MGNKDKTSVWLDLNSCLIPSGYDAGLIVPGIKKMLEDLGHHGPVTITATGDLKNIPEHVLRALFSSGINVTYVPKGIKSLFQCMLEWKSSNPPPATIMIIASIYHLHNMCVATRDDEVDKAYNFVEVYARPHFQPSGLHTRAGLFWENILFDNKQEPRSHFLLEKCSETSVTMDENLPGFFANAANFPAKALKVSPHISLVKNMHPGG
ncbi:PREDICTED: uncharacterized protein LOC104779755 [Camelina sativa]|uniref:Uncharacterized protein LOC104779755 n=1 Tax=Camelina sativa TaxID=90675 RepID=A0ABM0YKL0_CAMSA|nr:PREDICTED: uncharacterized protein LOC104779755 [Camelina sativa]